MDRSPRPSQRGANRPSTAQAVTPCRSAAWIAPVTVGRFGRLITPLLDTSTTAGAWVLAREPARPVHTPRTRAPAAARRQPRRHPGSRRSRRSSISASTMPARSTADHRTTTAARTGASGDHQRGTPAARRRLGPGPICGRHAAPSPGGKAHGKRQSHATSPKPPCSATSFACGRSNHGGEPMPTPPTRSRALIGVPKPRQTGLSMLHVDQEPKPRSRRPTLALLYARGRAYVEGGSLRGETIENRPSDTHPYQEGVQTTAPTAQPSRHDRNALPARGLRLGRLEGRLRAVGVATVATAPARGHRLGLGARVNQSHGIDQPSTPIKPSASAASIASPGSAEPGGPRVGDHHDGRCSGPGSPPAGIVIAGWG